MDYFLKHFLFIHCFIFFTYFSHSQLGVKCMTSYIINLFHRILQNIGLNYIPVWYQVYYTDTEQNNPIMSSGNAVVTCAIIARNFAAILAGVAKMCIVQLLHATRCNSCMQ